MPADLPDDFELLSTDSSPLTVDEEIAAIPFPDDLTAEVAPPPIQPFGSTWLFDFEEGRTVRYGGTPAIATGINAAIMVCQAALHTKRMETPIFSEDFGMDEPDRLIGRGASTIQELEAEYTADIEETLLAAHERVVSVDNIVFAWDQEETYATVSADVTFDNGEEAAINGVIQAGA